MTFQKNAGAVRRFGTLLKFANWLQNLPHKLTPAPFRLLQIGSAFWQSRALYVAARLDIATTLGDDSLSANALAERVSAQPQALFRLLRLLAAMGVFEEVTPGVFRNNALSACLREDRRKNVRAMVLMHNSPEMSLPWLDALEHGVRTGAVPFQTVHGEPLYAYMDHHAEFDALFARAMDSVEALAGDSFATDVDWGRFDRVIDIGGSKGSKTLAILRRHPRLKALVFDREQVVTTAQAYWCDREPPELLDRVTWQAGDLLSGVPAAQGEKDIYLLCAVLHGMDDDTCVQALGQLARAVGATGARVALMELVVPDLKADLSSASFDMQMFMATRGKERTLREWRQLFERSGWALEEQIGLQSLGAILMLRTRS